MGLTAAHVTHRRRVHRSRIDWIVRVLGAVGGFTVVGPIGAGGRRNARICSRTVNTTIGAESVGVSRQLANRHSVSILTALLTKSKTVAKAIRRSALQIG